MRRVLLVDDDPDHSEVLRMLLADLGVTDVVMATDAPSAERAIAHHVPNVVVADYRMPGADGLEFLAGVARSAPGARRVLMTGLDPAAVRRQPGASAAHMVLQKAFDVDALLAGLREALGPDVDGATKAEGIAASGRPAGPSAGRPAAGAGAGGGRAPPGRGPLAAASGPRSGRRHP